jgi:hypothetical protein
MGDFAAVSGLEKQMASCFTGIDVHQAGSREESTPARFNSTWPIFGCTSAVIRGSYKNLKAQQIRLVVLKGSLDPQSHQQV